MRDLHRFEPDFHGGYAFFWPVGAQVVAEGVENSETMKARLVIGVDYLQEYFFGIPAKEPISTIDISQ